MKLIVVFSTLLIAGMGFSQVSVKGNWSEIEKNTLIEELKAARGSFETFLDSSQVDVMILCLADKIEAEFENMDEMDGNSNDVEHMTFQCLEKMGLLNNEDLENVLSEKGNWSKFDRSQAYANLEYTRNVMNEVVDSSQVDLLFDCVVDKLEMTYESLTEASNDGENVSQLTSDCIKELNLFENTSTSIKGNWSPADKAALEEQLEYLRADLEKQASAEKVALVFNCIREKFENAFDNYEDINNHPETYRGILDECYSLLKQ
ncbi:MAG: hypothetical protein Crog4KO_27380 [Crocinitomicaceae bacterium]